MSNNPRRKTVVRCCLSAYVLPAPKVLKHNAYVCAFHTRAHALRDLYIRPITHTHTHLGWASGEFTARVAGTKRRPTLSTQKLLGALRTLRGVEHGAKKSNTCFDCGGQSGSLAHSQSPAPLSLSHQITRHTWNSAETLVVCSKDPKNTNYITSQIICSHTFRE
jgi:hypothetical protein